MESVYINLKQIVFSAGTRFVSLTQKQFYIMHGIFFFVVFLLLTLLVYLVFKLRKKTKELKKKNIEFEKEIKEHEKDYAALKISEEKYKNLIENSEQAILVTQNKNIIFLNEALCKISGYSKDEIVNKKFTNFIYPEDIEILLKKNIERIRKYKQSEYDLRLLTKSGQIKWIHLNSFRINWESEKAVFSYIYDITQNKISEEELIKSEEKFRQAAELAPFPISLTSSSGYVEFVNSKFTQVFGYTLEDVPHQEKWFQLAYPDPKERDKLLDNWEKTMKNEEDLSSKTWEFKVTCKNGEKKDVVFRIAKILNGEKILIIFEDITEQKRLQKQIKNSEEKFRLIFELSPLTTAVMDENGNFLMINNEFIKTTEYELEEVKSIDTWFKLAYPDPELREKLLKLWLNDLERAKTEQIEPVTISIQTKSGKTKLLFMHLAYIPEFKQYFVIGEDVTERIKTNETLTVFKKFAESAGQGFGMSDFDGNITYANKALIQILEEENFYNVKNKNVFRYHDTKSKKIIETEIAEKIMKDNQWTGELTIYTAEKNRIPVIENVFVIKNEENEPLCLANIITDISERKEYERTLNENHEKMNALLNVTGDMSFLLDREGKFIAVNNTAAKYFKSEPEELIGKCIYDFFSEEEVKIRKQKVDKAFETGKIYKYEEVSSHIYDVTVYPVFNQFNEVYQVAVYLHDITDIKEAEKALIESEKRYKIVFDSVEDAICIINPKTKKLLDANEKTFEMFGYSKTELIDPETVSPGFSPFTNKEAYSYIEKAAKGEHLLIEWLSKKKNGELFWIEISLKSAAISGEKQVIANIRDITQRKKAALELKYTKDYLKNIFDAVSTIIISVEKSGKITKWNKAAFLNSKIEPKNAVGKLLWEVFPLLKEFKKNIEETIEKNQPFYSHRIKLLPSNNQLFDISIQPFVFNEEEVAVIQLSDITEIEEKDKQLFEAQKMEIVGNIAGGLAHDFNNVLAGISGTIALMKYSLNKEVDKEHLKHDIDVIEKASKRAADMVNRLLSLSRKKDLTFSIIDINKPLKDIYKICLNSFDKSIELNFQFLNEPAYVNADPSQIEQVILNLCLNSAHAMTLMKTNGEPHGGQLSVSVKSEIIREKEDPKLIPGKYWRIEIIDTGVGIEEENLKKIFEPFFTTKGKIHGTGLGLFMVYNIIQKHNGIIKVKSEKGKGTEFSIYLPAAEKIIEETEERDNPFKITKGSGTVLIVDDEELIRATAQTILEECGYKILLAENGLKGVEIYKEKSSSIDLVILDMAMPKLSGKDTFIEMKKIRNDVKVILISGFVSDSRIQETLDLGAKLFLHKPFSMQDLSEKVFNIINN